MVTVELTCCVCGRAFERRAAEHKRNQKLGRKTLCGRRCHGLSNTSNLPVSTPEQAGYLKGFTRLDHMSPFRWHLNAVRRRSIKTRRGSLRKKPDEVTLTLEDLKDQWELQAGICPYTGWSLKNMPTTNSVHQLPLTPDRASLDRIDSTKWYVKGNIQFVSYMAQCAKNMFSEQELINFCKQVVAHEQAKLSGGDNRSPGPSCDGDCRDG